MSMFILLPSEEGPRGFAKMVARLSGNNLRAATYKDNLSFKTVDVQLPKFKMEIESKEELIPVSTNCTFIVTVPLRLSFRQHYDSTYTSELIY